VARHPRHERAKAARTRTQETTVPSNPRRVVAVIGVALVAVLAPLIGAAAPAGAADTAGTPSAMSLVRAMAADGVTLTQRRDEGPGALVADGLCSHLAEGGCVRAVITKDANLLLFDTAQHAADFAGCGDDRSTRLGRLTVSFGAPARVGEARQSRYVDVVRHYRATHPRRANDLARVQQALMRHGLPMRDAHADNAVQGETRAGHATDIPGAVDMVSTKQVDVIVFGTATAAEDYAGAADDQTYRRGRVVLSFGNPALLGSVRQQAYARALRHAMSSTGQTFASVRSATDSARSAASSVVEGCGG